MGIVELLACDPTELYLARGLSGTTWIGGMAGASDYDNDFDPPMEGGYELPSPSVDGGLQRSSIESMSIATCVHLGWLE